MKRLRTEVCIRWAISSSAMRVDFGVEYAQSLLVVQPGQVVEYRSSVDLVDASRG